MIKKQIREIWIYLKNGIIPMIGANTINKMISFINTMIITRILTKEEYGIWSYVANCFSYLVIISGFGLASGAYQYGAENRGNEKEYSYYKYCIKKGSLVNFAIVFCAIIFSGFYISISDTLVYVRLCFPVLILCFMFEMLLNIMRCQNRIKEYADVLNINSILIFLGMCGGAYFGVGGIIAGQYFAYFFSILNLFFKLKREILNITKAGCLEILEKKELWKYSIGIGGCSALNYLVFLLDVSMIANLLKDATIVGIYKVGTLIPNALNFIPSSIIAAVLPNIIYHVKDKAWVKKQLRKIYAGLILINLAICLFIEFFAPNVIMVIAGEQYNEAALILRILIIGYFFTGTLRVMSTNILAVYHKVKTSLLISVIAGILDVALNYLLIHWHGMVGAAVATLITEMLTGILAFSIMYIYIYRGGKNEKDI